MLQILVKNKVNCKCKKNELQSVKNVEVGRNSARQSVHMPVMRVAYSSNSEGFGTHMEGITWVFPIIYG